MHNNSRPEAQQYVQDIPDAIKELGGRLRQNSLQDKRCVWDT